MGLFNLFSGNNINTGVAEFNNTDGARLIDVREKDEYLSGHIKGSINIPLSCIEEIKNQVKDLNTPVFLYCLSGARSSNAAKYIKQYGYTCVKNIGGINGYTGEIVR